MYESKALCVCYINKNNVKPCTPMHTSTQCDAMHEASLTISGVLVRAVFVIVIVIVFPRLLTDVFPHLGEVLPW